MLPGLAVDRHAAEGHGRGFTAVAGLQRNGVTWSGGIHRSGDGDIFGTWPDGANGHYDLQIFSRAGALLDNPAHAPRKHRTRCIGFDLSPFQTPETRIGCFVGKGI